MRPLLALLAALLPFAAPAQQPPAPPPPAPPMTAANPDGTITFRFRDAGAQAVLVETDATPKPLPMTKGENGLWSATRSTMTFGPTSSAFTTTSLCPAPCRSPGRCSPSRTVQ